MAIEEVDVPDFDSHVAHATRQTDRLVFFNQSDKVNVCVF